MIFQTLITLAVGEEYGSSKVLHILGLIFIQLVTVPEHVTLLKKFPISESLVSDIPAGDGKMANLFLKCTLSSMKLKSLFRNSTLGAIKACSNH
jgi:hypothetical protein